MSFYLFGKPDETLRLKSYSGASRSGKNIIKIEIEVSDAVCFGFALGDLDKVQAGQRAAKPEKPHPQPKAALLALPAPQLALPRAEDLE